MASFETSIGGRQGAFPETAWSSVLSIRDLSSPRRREALDRLFRQYWRPVYTSIRLGWRRPVEEAKDLTQEFFRHLLERDFVASYQPELGRFRRFLMGALRNFLAEAGRDGAREKRGGGRPVLSLDVEELERGNLPADGRQRTPEEIFDLQWRREVMARSLSDLERTLDGEGRSDVFRAYAAYTSEEGASYEDVARRLSVPVTQITHHIHNARQRLREILLGRITEYAASAEEAEAEFRDLFPS